MSHFKSQQAHPHNERTQIQQRNFYSEAATDELISKAHRTEKIKSSIENNLGAILKKTGGGHSRMRQAKH